MTTLTVTATQGGGTFQGMLLRIKVLTGAADAASQTGHIAVTSAAYNTTIITTVTGSIVYGAISGENPYTAEPLCTLIDNANDSTNGEQYGTFRTTSATGTPGSVLVGSSTTYVIGSMAAAEILAAGTIAEDASAPAVVTSNVVTTLTTASFTPPPGSLLVALIPSDGSGTVTTTMAVTDTGGGLTWIPLAQANASNQEYAGVWVAQVPAAAPAAVQSAYQLIPVPPGWFPGSQRATANPNGIPFYQVPQPVTEPGAVIIPPPPVVPPAPPDSLPRLGPGWFPGSDRASVRPGGIPFYQIPQPVPQPPPSPSPPVIVGASADGTHFVDQYGTPRLLVGEDIWDIIINAGRWNGGNYRADIDAYTASRAAQGYNAAEVEMFSTNAPNSSYVFNDGREWDGTWPFNGSTDPTTTPNPAFWARRDYFLASCAANGITVVFSASTAALGVVGCWILSWTTAQWQAYGTFLAGRYANTPNIFWITGDDYFGAKDTELTAWLGSLRAAGDTHLVTMQNQQETTSRLAFNPTHSADPNSFDVNAQYDWVYTYNPSYNGVTYAQHEEPGPSDIVRGPIPALWGDGFYLASGTGIGQTDVRLERQNIWWALSSGAAGFTTGDNEVYPWASTAPALVTSKTFYSSVMPAISTAFRSLPGWYNLVSDWNSALVISGRGSRIADTTTGSNGYIDNTDNYVSASFAPDGSLAVIYCAKAFSITIDQSKIATGYTVTWIDPVNGAQTAGTPGSTYNSGVTKGSNSAGDPDWVLVLQGTPFPAPVPGLPDWLPLPPGWFPGADRVTAIPGGVPFTQVQAPTDQNAPVSGATSASVPLSETGAGADALSLVSTVGLSETGAGSDALGVTAGVALADTGSGADTLAATASVPLAEAGAALDAFSVAVGAALTESGAGTEAAGILPGFAETGAGTDTLSLASPVPLADTGTGTDSAGIMPGLTETGAGTDSLTATVVTAVSLTDAGAGIDSLAAMPGLAETGAGSDALAVAVSVAFTETGAGTDGSAAPPVLTETGAGSDALDIAVGISLTDTGAGSDSLTASVVTIVSLTDAGAGAAVLGIVPGLTETGAGADTLGLTSVVGLTESGVGTDTPGIIPGFTETGTGSDGLTVGMTQPFTETGAGTDSLTTSIVLTVALTDTGAGTDFLSVVSANAVALTDAGTGSDSFAQMPGLTETGTGTDSLAIVATVALAEAGASLDALGVMSGVGLSESGTGTDSLTTSRPAPLSDTGAGVASLGIVPGLNETGQGSDSLLITIITGFPGQVTIVQSHNSVSISNRSHIVVIKDST